MQSGWENTEQSSNAISTVIYASGWALRRRAGAKRASAKRAVAKRLDTKRAGGTTNEYKSSSAMVLERELLRECLSELTHGIRRIIGRPGVPRMQYPTAVLRCN